MSEKLFKLMQDNNNAGRQVIVIEDGLRREPIMMGVHPQRYMNEGFKRYIPGSYSRSTETVVNVQQIFTNITYLLNAYLALDVLNETKYDEILQSYDRFISEAVEFGEIEVNLGISSLEIKPDRRKKVFKKKRGR